MNVLTWNMRQVVLTVKICLLYHDKFSWLGQVPAGLDSDTTMDVKAGSTVRVRCPFDPLLVAQYSFVCALIRRAASV